MTTPRPVQTDEAPRGKAKQTGTIVPPVRRRLNAGCGLYRLAGGGWLLTRWSLCRELPDLAAVGAVLRAMGVRA